MFHFHKDAERADVLACTFDTWKSYEDVIANGPARDTYLEAMYIALIGRVLPLHVTFKVRVPIRSMTDRERDASTLLDLVNVNDNMLHVAARVSHPELDGYEVTAEMLPMLASRGTAREVARRVAGQHTTGRRYATCHRCGIMFMTEGQRLEVETCKKCAKESGL